MRNLKIFTDKIEQSALQQINELLEQEAFKDCKVRIMPDVHSGIGCVIGFTADLGDKVVPNLVGTDIGCGVIIVPLGKINIDLEKLDNYIKSFVSYGFAINTKKLADFNLRLLRCYDYLRRANALEYALGSLGGGNHFIEIDTSADGDKYLLIHTGSRNLGLQVASIYQKLAVKLRKTAPIQEREELIATLKKQNRQSDIPQALEKLAFKYRNETKLRPELCYLDGKDRDDYLHDMRLCQEWAKLNRRTLVKAILNHLQKDQKLRFEQNPEKVMFESVHNYIGDDNIIRKGAISARKGEKVLIPINMRDGCILGIGKGNEDWNYSAPHGAGRILSRGEAKKLLSMEEFTQTMAGIYSTSVVTSTLDESPMAYKPIEDITSNIGDTVEIIEIIKPIYNFKASE